MDISAFVPLQDWGSVAAPPVSPSSAVGLVLPDEYRYRETGLSPSTPELSANRNLSGCWRNIAISLIDVCAGGFECNGLISSISPNPRTVFDTANFLFCVCCLGGAFK